MTTTPTSNRNGWDGPGSASGVPGREGETMGGLKVNTTDVEFEIKRLDELIDQAMAARDWYSVDIWIKERDALGGNRGSNAVIDDLIQRAGQAVMSDGSGEGTQMCVRDWLEAQKVP